MTPRRLAFYLPVTLLVGGLAHGQPNQATDLIPALTKQCKIIKQLLASRARMASTAGGPALPSDDFNQAGDLCARLEASVESPDAAAAAQTSGALYQLLARMNLPPATAADRFAALESAASGKAGQTLFVALVNLAKVAFEAGKMEKATAYAEQLLQMAPQFPDGWNYGNAIYYGHFVLGRVALERGDIGEAASQLMGAGATPGSPQLNSFGPNVTLARDLLAQGQAEPVLQYLQECRSFWKHDRGKLDQWIAAVVNGATPDFSSNLNY